MSADSSASAPASVPAPTAVAPVPEGAAIAILGSMILMIVALTALLVLTTWVEPAAAAEALVLDGGGTLGR